MQSIIDCPQQLDFSTLKVKTHAQGENSGRIVDYILATRDQYRYPADPRNYFPHVCRLRHRLGQHDTLDAYARRETDRTMKNKLRYPAIVALAAGSMLLTACAKNLPELPVASVPNTAGTSQLQNGTVALTNADGQTRNNAPLEIIANDLVSALSYISGMDPKLATIRTPAAGSDFDELVKVSMQNNGYTFDDRFDRASGEQLNTAYLKTDRSVDTSELTGIISINSVFVKRTYILSNGTITPKTSYVIRGINPQLVQAHDNVLVL